MVRFLRSTGLIAVLAAVVAWAALAQAQRTPPPQRPAKPAPAQTTTQTSRTSQPAAKPGDKPAGSPQTTAGADTSAGPDLGDIDQILEGEEEVLSGSGFSYDPGNRRDPFKSLLAARDRPEFRGQRPEGIAGLLIDEIDLTGIFRTSKGFVAQVAAANQKKSYLLKEGDQLYDGDVVSINHNEVVFKQVVQDPTALKPFREVVKSLNPS
jgi:Tfp pilus assembly protein PilP